MSDNLEGNNTKAAAGINDGYLVVHQNPSNACMQEIDIGKRSGNKPEIGIAKNYTYK